MDSPDASLDKEEGPTLGTLEGGEEEHQQDAEASKPGVEGLEEDGEAFFNHVRWLKKKKGHWNFFLKESEKDAMKLVCNESLLSWRDQIGLQEKRNEV